MKKAFPISLIALLLIASPAFAEDTTPALKAEASAALESKKPKTEPLLTRKQKIEGELRATATKLQTVIDRTQVLIDLLSKNDKDTSAAAATLVEARSSLEEAIAAIDQFAGVALPEQKTESKDGVAEKATKAMVAKEVVLLKDPLKKAQEALKASKASLIESIASLKQGLLPKSDDQQ